jgi:hypothetical protein
LIELPAEQALAHAVEEDLPVHRIPQMETALYGPLEVSELILGKG